MLIESPSNPRVKALVALGKDRKARDAAGGMFLIEGIAPLGRAVRAGFIVSELWHSGPVSPIAAGQHVETTHAVLSRITGKDNPQTALGVVRQRWVSPPERVGSLWLALDRPRDPGNLGTIIRTADAVAADGLILIGEATDPYSPECVRASSGSIVNVPLVRLAEDEFAAWSRRQAAAEVAIVGTAGDAVADFREVDAGRPVVLVMGNESEGLSAPLRALCTQLLKIPMPGGTESLNLAIATGLMLYEVVRRRK